MAVRGGGGGHSDGSPGGEGHSDGSPGEGVTVMAVLGGSQ